MILSQTLQDIAYGEDGVLFVKPSFIVAWSRFEYVCGTVGLDINGFIADCLDGHYC